MPESNFDFMVRDSCLFRALNLERHSRDLSHYAQKFEEEWKKNPSFGKEASRAAGSAAEGIAQYTEWVLLYCEPLSRTSAASELLSERDLARVWGSQHPIQGEAERLIAACTRFLSELNYYILRAGAEVVDAAEGLPPELHSHFNTARHLFSVEMEEMGAFATLRGLEATLRAIMKRQQVVLDSGKRGTEPLCETDLHDIIEAAKHLRWDDAGGQPLLSKRDSSLLQHLRQCRNVSAHAGDLHELETPWPEVATLAVKATVALWRASRAGERVVEPRTITKGW